MPSHKITLIISLRPPTPPPEIQTVPVFLNFKVICQRASDINSCILTIISKMSKVHEKRYKQNLEHRSETQNSSFRYPKTCRSTITHSQNVMQCYVSVMHVILFAQNCLSTVRGADTMTGKLTKSSW